MLDPAARFSKILQVVCSRMQHQISEDSINPADSVSRSLESKMGNVDEAQEGRSVEDWLA